VDVVNGSKVLKHAARRWDGVAVSAYKDDPAGFLGVTRQTLLGDGEGEEALQFLTRYFEVAPGGYTTLEHHRHPHAVVVLHGRGSVLLDGEENALEPFDCVYVAPGAVHSFRAAAEEALGFLCVVDRVRDRPVPVAPEAAGPAGG
jgi:quercetin dioxygenase-like cupin family protein